MKKGKNEKYFEDIMANFKDYPEFQFSEGNFFDRLQNLAYFQIGDFQYPAHILLHHLLEDYSEKLQVKQKNITFSVVQTPVYKIKSDIAIMGQDINRIVGPVEEMIEETDSTNSIEDTIKLLERFRPSKQGDILVSNPSWCAAKCLWEAVIYHFEGKKMTNAKIVRSTLHNCFKKVGELNIKCLSMDALGTEFHSLSIQTFVDILCETLFLEAHNLNQLEEIFISAKTEMASKAIKKAIKKTLKMHCFYSH